MTVATLEFIDPATRKGFQHLRKDRRTEYDRMPLSGLKHAYRRLSYQAEQTAKPSLVQEREYIRQNIQLIQLCRGVI